MLPYVKYGTFDIANVNICSICQMFIFHIFTILYNHTISKLYYNTCLAILLTARYEAKNSNDK